MKIIAVFLILMITLVGYQPLYQVSGIGNLSSDKLTDIKADISSFRMIRPEFSNNPPVYEISNNSEYEMVNLFNAHELVKNITGSSNMGEGVTIAVIDTGIINHSTFKYYPDEDGNPDNSSIRTIEYIDINHYYASNGSTIYTTDYFTISNETMWSYNIDYEEDNAPVFNNSILNQYQRLGVHDQKNTTHGSLVLGVLLAIAP